MFLTIYILSTLYCFFSIYQDKQKNKHYTIGDLFFSSTLSIIPVINTILGIFIMVITISDSEFFSKTLWGTKDTKCNQ